MKDLTVLFEAYYELLNKRYQKSEQLLNISLDKAFAQDNLPKLSIWLWVIAEQVERSKNDKLLHQYHESIEHIISLITDRWNQPTYNLWQEQPNILHMSNLGIYYGTLSAIKRIKGRENLQKVITEIRDYVFDYGLSNGMLVRTPKSKEISTDLLITVMPFGLYSPEDLVMVEAVKTIENNLVANQSIFRYRGAATTSPASASWLAWYFTEKGDLKKAKYYLRLSENLDSTDNIDENELAKILFKIVNFYLDETLEGDHGIQIIHTPYGTDNPYTYLKTERIPRDPKVGQEVKVRAQLWPEQEDVQVIARVKTLYRTFEVECISSDVGHELVWEASLGSFSFNEEVSYSFLIRKGNEVIKNGDDYYFSPLQMNNLTAIQKLTEKENEIWFQGTDQLQLNTVYLGILNTEQGPQIKVHFDKSPIKDGIETKEVSASVMNITFIEEKDNFTLQSNSWKCILDKSPFQIRLLHSLDHSFIKGYDKAIPVFRWLVNCKGEIKQAEWSFKSELDERFFGFGERFNRFEQRGEKLDTYVYNQYRDQGTRTYLPVPFYISSKGYGLFLETAYYSTFDLGSHFQDLLSITSDLEGNDSSFSFRIFVGNPKEIIQNYTNVTGKPVFPPTWAFGPWMSSNNWDRDSVVRKQVELTNYYKIPSTVFVIEQWSDEATYYIFNDAQYKLKSGSESFAYEDFHFPTWGRWPDPKGLFEYLHENGLKVVLWQIPIQKYLNKQYHLQKDEDEKYMIAEGYCVKHSDGTPYRMPEGWFKESLLMDFSDSEGVQWWFNKRQYLLDIGVDGFKTDGGEFVFGKELRFSDGRTGAEMRNIYPNDYIEAYYRFATEHNQGDAITFSRAGFTGAQNFPAHWAGDERSTFNAFQNSLIAGLTSGISGIPFWGWDLAGFNGDIPSAELFIRSAQMAAFCPIMQYHAESKAEFNQDRTPWNIAERTGDERALEGYRFFANVRMNLLPYIFDQSKVSSETGIPLMRALFIEYPEDESTYSIYDEYLFGDYLLVAPIIEQGTTERMVYFPEGTWINIWTNEIVEGPEWKRVNAQLMEIPVYIKGDTALLINCDESLEFGSYVGNAVDAFNMPVLRIYPIHGFNQIILDHLNHEWKVNVRVDDYLHLDISGYDRLTLMIPRKLILKEKVFVNGIKRNTSDFLVEKGKYIIQYNPSI